MSFRAKKTIGPAHADQPYVYRLLSGWCARTRYMRDGRSQISAILLPGDIFAVKAMFLDTLPDEIVAVTDIEVESADQAGLRQAASEDWEIMLRLAWQLVEDDRRIHNWLIAIGRGSAEERAALLLVDIKGRLALAGLIAADAEEMPWPLTQQDVAQILGLTAVHVNRTFKTLRERGLASIERRVAHLDTKALHDLAQPLLDAYERKMPEFGCAERAL